MKKLILVFAVVILSTGLFAQVSPNKYWIKFTDKSGTPYNINNPEEFLSQRAIDRRLTQGIAITEQDLPVNPSYVAAVEAVGVTLLNTSKWFNSVTVFTTNPAHIATIEGLSFVQSVEKSVANSSTSNDKFLKPFFDNESYMDIPQNGALKSSTSGNSYDYGMAFNQIDMLNGIALHDLGFNGTGMVIAVLDAGFLNADEIAAFDYLWTNGKILGYRDFVEPNNPNLFDSHYHGTMVLSTMGANLPGEMVGTAPEADYWLLRSEDGESETLIEELNWVSAAEFADSVGADVINSSLGYTTFDDPSQDHTYQDMDGNTTPITIGADIASSKGLLVVNSAGNSGGGSWQYIGAPADGDSVFSIGAVNSSGNYASFSSTGPTFDGRIKPNVVAQGSGSTIIEPYGGTVSSGSGTSFSSPITAGMVACLWQAHPDKRNTEIMEAIQASATQATNPDAFLGYGIPDYLLAHDNITNAVVYNAYENAFEVFPNPFDGEIFITANFDIEGPLDVSITDINGKVLHSISIEVMDLGGYLKFTELENLSAGVYFTRIVFNGNSLTKKLVKK
ncbi:MAG: S8 family serine peptidase [Bacteroidales bacterium]|nr:S8 family serine peptidase [Bacteroidales bacterium]MCF8403975.1 S8 family serine peptidase [Bacteroidales bacterium]